MDPFPKPTSEREPAAQPEKQEMPYAMNLLTNREFVINSLVSMEGKAWLEKQSLFPDEENTVDWALVRAKKTGSAMIYGEGGYHRYVVKHDGSVRFVGYLAPSKIDEAKKLGFEIAI